jgi:hypothetical protein
MVAERPPRKLSGAITVGMARPRRELWISRDSMRADEPTHPDDRGHSAGVKAAP